MRFLLAFIVISLFASGCSNSNSTTEVNSNTGPIVVPATVVPKVGSTFTYQMYQIDTNGIAKNSGTTITDSVVETGISYQGKNNVVHFQYSVSKYYPKDNYASYEPNGDISFYNDDSSFFQINMLGTGWYTFPVQSHVTQPYVALDTTIDVGGGQTNYKHIEDTIRYGAALRDSVGGNPLVLATCQNVGVGNWFNDGVFTMRVIDTTDVSFAPAIGYPRDVTVHPARYSATLAEPEWEYRLVQYSVK